LNERFTTSSQWRRRGLRALAAIAVALLLISIVGSALLVSALPRYLTSANRLRFDSRTHYADQARQELQKEEIIRQQASLIFAAGQCLFMIVLLLVSLSIGAIAAFGWLGFNQQFALRRMEQILIQLKEPQRHTGLEPPPFTSKQHAFQRVRPRQIATGTVVVILGCILLVVLFRGVSQAVESKKRLRDDAILIQQMADGSDTPAAAPTPGRDFTLSGPRLDMIWVEHGSFLMGGNGDYDGRPITRVTLTRGFWLGKYELTHAQYVAVTHKKRSGSEGELMPAGYVSWMDAVEFCRRLTKMVKAAGCLPEGYVYTLPTEAQWEYACRADTTGEYAGDLDAMGWYDKNSKDDLVFPWFGGERGAGPKPIGQKKPNAWGFYDMHGNVNEWCLDWYAPSLPGGSVTNPTGPSAGILEHVVRGGSWQFPGIKCTSAARKGSGKDHRTNEGCRIALVWQGSPVPGTSNP
jgi:formylglycine-generating enzyme required for sulfatase activity